MAEIYKVFVSRNKKSESTSRTGKKLKLPSDIKSYVFLSTLLSVLAFVHMQITSWLPNGCHIASYHVWAPERSKKEEGEETPADFRLSLIGQHYQMATADFRED